MEDVEKEIDAQIRKAFKLGLNPTHIDSHMYSVGASAEFFEVYRQAGEKYNLPVMISKQLMDMVGLDTSQALKEGDLLIDKAHYGIFEYFESKKLAKYYSDVFEDLVPGLNIILIHPAFNDNEMKGITIDHPNFGSEWRQIDFDSFNTKEIRYKLEQNDIELITWNDIKNTGRKSHNKDGN